MAVLPGHFSKLEQSANGSTGFIIAGGCAVMQMGDLAMASSSADGAGHSVDWSAT